MAYANTELFVGLMIASVCLSINVRADVSTLTPIGRLAIRNASQIGILFRSSN